MAVFPLASTAVRLSIATKLFLTLLLATTLVVAAMYGFMHWSFQHGFVSFLESRQQARVARMIEQLAEVYQEEGGWDGLRLNRMRWWRLMADPASAGERTSGPPWHERPHHRSGRGPREMDTGLALLDADKSILLGRGTDIDKLSLTPIRVDGRTVGYVGRLPGPTLRELVDVRFVEAQRRSFLWIALLVGVLAVALSWPLANTLVRPLKRITEAARGLAAGRFATRVSVSGNDELSDLGRDFNAMAQTLERTETARRQWMADISHELRTPLALLRAELEAMQDGVRPLSPESVMSLQTDVTRLNRLVEDLYQLSMTDLGALSYQKRPVDPVGLLRDDVDTLSGEFERHGLQIDVRNAVAGPVTLQADPDRLSQLFRNLMHNSLRYTDAGGRLEIGVSRFADRLVFDFCDSAPGVPVDALPQLFERFYRVEASRNRAHGGAGLGLAICRNIVEAHDGRIEARPSPLGGVCIHIELPLTT